MNISLKWLSDYVEIDRPASELEELLTQTGLNFEGYVEADNDTVMDLEVTSNRPDWLGHIGVARELAAATGKSFRKPTFELPNGSGDVNGVTSVEVRDAELCSRYTARVIRNVKVGPSPQWLVDCLEAVGLRSINNIVDITNFVLMEYSQPLHAFDFDKLAGGKIVVRRAEKGEKLVAIDETTCELTDEMLVIADAENPVAIAGIMGGLTTEVSEQTTTVLLESAAFDPLTTRKTSRQLGLFSDSNFRFERGVDPVAIDEASQRACALICELAGGEMVGGMIDVWPKPWVAPVVTLRPKRTSTLLGIDVPVERQIEILTKLGLDVKAESEQLVCTVPSFRADLTREVDLIEEVARLVGYSSLPILGEVAHPVRPMGQIERIRRKVTSTLAGCGYNESITFSFIDDDEAALFGVAEPIAVDANVRRSNNALRPSLLPSLLKACKSNQSAGNLDVDLFELAAVFPPAKSGGLPEEHIQLALVTMSDLRDLRGAMETAIEAIIPNAAIVIKPAAAAGLNEQVSAEVVLNGQVVGCIGRIAPAVQKYYGLEQTPAVATVRFDALIAGANLTRTATPLAKFPAIRRDLSFILDESVRWEQLAVAIDKIDQPLRIAEEYVTTYRGKQIPKGKKSLTLTLEYRSPNSTLTHEQVEAEVTAIVEMAKTTFQAELRQ